MATLTRPSLSLERPKSLAAQLAKDLTDRIARGDLKPGDKLPSEHEMVASYGVSRTVVREAVSSLKSAGLVSARQGVGVFVLAPSAAIPFRIDAQELDTVKEVISLLELRISLESEAAALAAIRRTDGHIARLRDTLDALTRGIAAHEDAVDLDFRFHQEIALATDNRYFTELFNYLGMVAIPRARIGMYKADTHARTAYLQNVNREHQAIFQAIVNQDPDGARAAMRLHLGNSRERLKAASVAAS
ncbi:FadR/GntR family transcriptional regulator [Pusillimonas sp. SM2304]|uniref:FadR/GntR family transcriptional regulator n=1 Tax=Pusillimonas sp. SM2304 TaxID=3073241 RepID=UPI0028743A43|nr:FadR/GntR family transcriptional regulator [Pusillimonas sp. SM2304]MDS1140245.1 FadR/GntR family transcriptional regulator [Pusillimonas sp. SM2304]